MRTETKGYGLYDNPHGLRGFSLLEVMVVVAIIGVLLAISLPAAQKSKANARRIGCQANLRQLYWAWDCYLLDYDEYFYKGLNAELNYGGWKGSKNKMGRPLNSYVDSNIDENYPDGTAKVYLCPGDTGGVPNYSPYTKAFDIYGTSYIMNPLLVGYPQISVLTARSSDFHGAINRIIPNLRRDSVDNPKKVILMGDYPWVDQWKQSSIDIRSWHDKMDYYNILFLDGHIQFIQIYPGVYNDLHYTLLPSKTLYPEANKVQPGP
jgi:prepilin-type N-terminal cleavage/methylation domain-containing protein/prepilin-type processing-associated H-X9-DG protein